MLLDPYRKATLNESDALKHTYTLKHGEADVKNTLVLLG